MTELLAPKSGAEATEFLKTQVKSGKLNWPRMCLMLQRTARGLPGVYPTALSASQATPKSERVLNRADMKAGMVCFSWNKQPGTAGHIFEILGRTKTGTLLTITNDAVKTGGVYVVPFDFYEKEWGHEIQFAATWLNGYDFADFNAKPVETPEFKGGLGDKYEVALNQIKAIRNQKADKYGPKAPIVIALQRDVDRMKNKIARFKARA